MDGKPLKKYLHEGRNYVMGLLGKKYSIRVKNNTSKRVEVVASVDGLDVMDGKTADYTEKRGYVLAPWSSYDITGFRLTLNDVAAFTFSEVKDSYAALKGDDTNVGVIGVAFFPEKVVVIKPKPKPQPIVPHKESGKYYYKGYGGSGPGGEPKEKKSKSITTESMLKAEESSAGPLPQSGATDSLSYSEKPSEDEERQGLGTEFGEKSESYVSYTQFIRQNAKKPSEVVAIFYNDYKGLKAIGIDVDSKMDKEIAKRQKAHPFPGLIKQEFSEPPPGWNE
ncbi:MAG: hypothetical protein FJ088_01240 [Deltaproteobacteria bacterium]|nr:hypothetical protein [Deltaproteobacteria bacterium]